MVANGTNRKTLNFEDYKLFFNDPESANLTILQLNEIIHMHGFFKLKGDKRRKGSVEKAVKEVDELMNPSRSTLNESLYPYSFGVTLDQVNNDLDVLQWQEEAPVQSLQCVSYLDFNEGGFDDDGGAKLEKKPKRLRRVKAKAEKEREVFDAVHLTKPRSMRNRLKRKHIDDIGNAPLVWVKNV